MMFPTFGLAGQNNPILIGDAAQPDAVAQAMKQYPILNGIGLRAVNGQRGGNVLEFWPPGEPGSSDYARPSGLDLGAPGVEVGPKARPIDILADVVSHHLVNTDPGLKRAYSTFVNSVTPEQEQMLRNQYQYAKQSFGEKRNFDTWKEVSGLPAFFRGYPFQQWPAEFNQRAYTPQQTQLLDAMMRYLQQPQ